MSERPIDDVLAPSPRVVGVADDSGRPRRRLFVRSAVVAGIVIGGVAVGFWLLGSRLIAPAPRTIGPPQSRLSCEDFALDAATGVVRGWHARRPDAKAVAVLLHGLRGDRRQMLSRAEWLHRIGFACVLPDLPAHGESDGGVITFGPAEADAARAAIAFAREQHPGLPVAVIGYSLGGAAAVLACAEPDAPTIDALVIEAVFPTLEDAIDNRMRSQFGGLASVVGTPLKWQLRPRLGFGVGDVRPAAVIDRVGCPVLVISGEDDPYTTAANSRTLFEAAAEPKSLWLVPGLGHADPESFDRRGYRKRVGRFLERLTDPRPAVR